MDVKQFTRDGLSFITVRNRNFFEVTFCSLGASVYDILYHFDHMSLTTKNTKDYLKTNLYYGKTIGRVAGRIKQGRIDINNRTYYLAINEDVNVLHGGYFGLSAQTFIPEIKQDDGKVVITYSYYSMDLESGFPGNLNVKIIYTMYEKEDNLEVAFEASCDKDSVLNLTNHLYFTLGEKNNDNLKLKMNASKYIKVDDENLLPLEEVEVDDEIFDFKEGMFIKEHVLDEKLTSTKANGYDHLFVIDKQDDYLLTLESSKYCLDIHSSYDCSIIYSDNIIDATPVLNTNQNQHRAVAIEPQKNQVGDISLKAYDVYKQYIHYHFRRK